MNYIKNIAHEQVLDFAKEVTIAKGQIVSKTLAQNKALSLTLFGFSQGEEISSHASNGDAMVHVIEGKAKVTIDGNDYVCQQGEVIIMPASKPHAVYALEDFKMLLTVVFPQGISLEK